jgi:hypothetical protein
MEAWLFQYSLGERQFTGLFRFNLPKMIRQQYHYPDSNIQESPTKARLLLSNLLPIIAFALKLGLLLAEKVGA